MILRDLFESDGVDINEGGVYVDVGAHHPRRFSNTQFFYELGWNGLNFEPNEGSKLIFERLRPRDKTIEIALSEKSGEMILHSYNEPALNSLINRDFELSSTNYKKIEKRIVRVSTLEVELVKYFNYGLQTPSFLDVDVEGLELEVLKGNSWNKFNFCYILTEIKENNIMHTSTCSTHNYLCKLNYRLVACTRLTGIYKYIKKKHKN